MVRLFSTVLISNILSCLIIVVAGTVQLWIFHMSSRIQLPIGLSAIRSNTQAANIIELILLISMMESAVICGYFAALFCTKYPLSAGIFSSAIWVAILQFVPPQRIGSRFLPEAVAACYYSVLMLGLVGAYLRTRHRR